MAEKANCPYCQKTLAKRPERKVKCPNCGNSIFVKTDPYTREKRIVTQEQAEQLEEHWKEKYQIEEWAKLLNQAGIAPKDIERIKPELTGNQIPVKAWKLLEEQAAKLTKKEQYHQAKMIYYSMAITANRKGYPFQKYLQLSARMELLDLKKLGVKKVKISTCGQKSCNDCQPLEGQIYKIDDAIKKSPIPHKKCSFILYGETPGFCRCDYLAVL